MTNSKSPDGSSPASARRGAGRRRFGLAFTGVALAAPLALVCYAGLAVPEAAARAQLVVAGSERIVLVLAIALLVRTLHAMAGGGSAPARAASRRLPDVRIGSGAFTA